MVHIADMANSIFPTVTNIFIHPPILNTLPIPDGGRITLHISTYRFHATSKKSGYLINHHVHIHPGIRSESGSNTILTGSLNGYQHHSPAAPSQLPHDYEMMPPIMHCHMFQHVQYWSLAEPSWSPHDLEWKID